jgi:hypothetical protein
LSKLLISAKLLFERYTATHSLVMIRTILVVTVLLIPRMLFAQETKWISCTSVSECAVGLSPCGDPMGVNKNFLDEFRDWSQKTLWSCRGPSGFRPTSNQLKLSCGTNTPTIEGYRCAVHKIVDERTLSNTEVPDLDLWKPNIPRLRN